MANVETDDAEECQLCFGSRWLHRRVDGTWDSCLFQEAGGRCALLAERLGAGREYSIDRSRLVFRVSLDAKQRRVAEREFRVALAALLKREMQT